MSSSRTAVPLAQAAHSGLNRLAEGTPKRVAPPFLGWPSAMPRAEVGAARLTEAMATAASSMMRLAIMPTTSGCTRTLSAATAAIFQASWSSRRSTSFDGWTRTSWLNIAGVSL